MDEKGKREGMSVKELEGYAKRHQFELVFVVIFLLATLFTFVFWGAAFSIFFAGVGGILGVLFMGKIEHFSKSMFGFIAKQENTTRIILAVVGCIFAIFLAPLIFLLLGLHGGKNICHLCKEMFNH